jgi:hypothetical protein
MKKEKSTNNDFELDDFEFIDDNKEDEEFINSMKDVNFVKRMKEIQKFFKENDNKIGN